MRLVIRPGQQISQFLITAVVHEPHSTACSPAPSDPNAEVFQANILTKLAVPQIA